MTVVQSARRGEPDLIVGNLLGSNVFNALLVTGVVAVVADAPVGDARLTGVGVVAMVVATALASAALLSARRLDRPEGALLVVTWVVSVVLL